MLKQMLWSAAVALALTAGPVTAALAQDSEEDPTVATVNGEKVLQSEVLELARNLPAQYQAQIDQVFPLLLNQLIDLKLVAIAAGEAGLADDDEVQERLEAQRVDIMRNIFLERAVAAEVTDEALQARYETFLTENPPSEEINARHILVETEDEAKDLIKKLDDGGDFAALASEFSTGPSKEQGGDLGYFSDGQMVPAFSEAAFAMEVGAHTAAPVQTEFGWHVIKVEDRRSQPPPPFDEVRDQLRSEGERDVITKMLEGLRGAATIEIVGASEEAADDAAPTEDGEQSN